MHGNMNVKLDCSYFVVGCGCVFYLGLLRFAINNGGCDEYKFIYYFELMCNRERLCTSCITNWLSTFNFQKFIRTITSAAEATFFQWN
jgi:hypothetical protein